MPAFQAVSTARFWWLLHNRFRGSGRSDRPRGRWWHWCGQSCLREGAARRSDSCRSLAFCFLSLFLSLSPSLSLSLFLSLSLSLSLLSLSLCVSASVSVSVSVSVSASLRLPLSLSLSLSVFCLIRFSRLSLCPFFSPVWRGGSTARAETHHDREKELYGRTHTVAVHPGLCHSVKGRGERARERKRERERDEKG